MVLKALLALALVLIAAACGPRLPPAEPDPPITHEVVTLVLPSVDGDQVDFARWRGGAVAVHLASTSSLDAQADVELLRAARDEVKGLVLVEIVVDDAAAQMAAPWADASKIDWAVLLPTPEVMAGASAFGRVRVIPTTFLLDREGRVSWRWEGGLRKGALARAVEELR